MKSYRIFQKSVAQQMTETLFMKSNLKVFFQGDDAPYRWKFYEKLGKKLNGNLTICYGNKKIKRL